MIPKSKPSKQQTDLEMQCTWRLYATPWPWMISLPL